MQIVLVLLEVFPYKSKSEGESTRIENWLVLYPWDYRTISISYNFDTQGLPTSVFQIPTSVGLSCALYLGMWYLGQSPTSFIYLSAS